MYNLKHGASKTSNRLDRVLLLALVGLLLLGSRSSWLPLIGGFLIASDLVQPSDAVLALAGDPLRVIYAADLFKRGYADRFVVTDMRLAIPNSEGEYTRIVRTEAIKLGVPTNRIAVAAGTVETTYQEALAVRQLAQTQGWRSLLVVTSPFHTRRSRIIFHHVFRDTGITVAVCSVESHWYTADSWWLSWFGIRDTTLEYLKLMLYALHYR